MEKIRNKKIIATLLVAIMLISNILPILPLLKSLGVKVNDTLYLDSIGTVDYHLKCTSVGSRRICNYKFSRIL